MCLVGAGTGWVEPIYARIDADVDVLVEVAGEVTGKRDCGVDRWTKPIRHGQLFKLPSDVRKGFPVFLGAAFHRNHSVVVIPLSRGSVELDHQHVEIPILGGHIDSPDLHTEHEVAAASHGQSGPGGGAVLGDHFNEIDGV